MKIIFSNDKEFIYTQAFGLEKDFKNGVTRPSIEIHMPIAQTSYNEIESIVNDVEVMKSFTLVGDAIVNMDGTLGETPMNTYTDYTIKGKITVEDDVLTFKMYKLSDVEIENREAMATIDELLIAMEV